MSKIDVCFELKWKDKQFNQIIQLLITSKRSCELVWSHLKWLRTKSWKNFVQVTNIFVYELRRKITIRFSFFWLCVDVLSVIDFGMTNVLFIAFGYWIFSHFKFRFRFLWISLQRSKYRIWTNSCDETYQSGSSRQRFSTIVFTVGCHSITNFCNSYVSFLHF